MDSDRGSPYLDDASMYSGVEDDGTVGYNVCKDCMVREVGEQCGGDNGADNYADSDPDSDDESSDNIEMDACPGMEFKGNGKNGNGCKTNGKNGNGCKTNGKNGNSKNGKNGKEDYFDCAKFMTNNKKGQKGKGKGPMPICELGGVNRCKPKNGKNGANGKNGSGNGRNGNGRNGNGRNGNGRNGMGNGKNGGSSCNGDDDDEAGMNLKKGNKDADCEGKMKDDDDQNCAGACANKECTIDWVYSTGFQNFFCIYKKKYCGKPCAELMKSAQNAYEDLCEFEKEKYRNICL